MNERETQIAFVIDMINDLCKSYEIGLIPFTNKHGVQMVIVEDARNGKKYAIVNND